MCVGLFDSKYKLGRDAYQNNLAIHFSKVQFERCYGIAEDDSILNETAIKIISSCLGY